MESQIREVTVINFPNIQCRFGSVHTTPERFENEAFRKRSLKEYENAGLFVFLWTENILKMEFFEDYDFMIIM